MNDREREVISDLIEMYRDSPCLWDANSEQYKDLKRKNEAWKCMLEKLKEIDPEANLVSVKKKMDNIRSCFKREFKKVIDSTQNGSPSDVHKPILWYFHMMTFLDKENELQRSGYTTLSSKEKLQAIIRSSRKTHQEKDNQNFLEASVLPDVVEQNSQNPKEHNAFGVYIGEQLGHMSTFQRQVAEKLIAEVVFLGKTENLNFDSRIETPSRSNSSSQRSRSFSRFHSPQYISSPSYHVPSPLLLAQDDNSSEPPPSPLTIPSRSPSSLPLSHSSPQIHKEPPSNSLLMELLTAKTDNYEEVMSVKLEPTVDAVEQDPLMTRSMQEMKIRSHKKRTSSENIEAGPSNKVTKYSKHRDKLQVTDQDE